MKDIKTKKSLRRKTDLQDSADDEKHLYEEETSIDLPDVKDIAGQEFIHVPNMDQFKDATAASDDEEGRDIWKNELVEEGVITDQGSDVSREEKELLELSANDMPTKDEQQLRRAALDERDDDGELLNERTSALSGSDLDIPGADDDNQNEVLGEEDEENNPYSLGGDEKSVNEERSGT
jgi:hypothetical protein